MTAVSPSSQEPQIYYSRRDQLGSRWPIKVWESPTGRSFEVGSKRFDTLAATLAELHGTTYQTWGWRRYACTGNYAPAPIVGEPTLTIVQVVCAPLSERLQGIVVAPVLRRGIDLDSRAKEVAKLLYKGFGAQIHANGYEFEDVLQEVFRKLVVSNQGKSPWDPTKSSFGHYVHMVCRSALYNLYRKDKARKTYEKLGGYTARDGEWVAVDVVDRADLVAPTELDAPAQALHDLSQYLLDVGLDLGDQASLCASDLAVRVLPYVREGYGRNEIAAVLNLKPSVVTKGLVFLRKHASRWLN